MINPKLPPQSIEAEQAVLGGLLIDNDALDRVADILHADDFYHVAHRLIFERIQAMLAENKPADIITVAESLERSDIGLPYLVSLAEGVPGTANIRHYAYMVRESSRKRELLASYGTAIEFIYDNPTETSSEIIQRSEGVFLAVSENSRKSGAGFRELSTLLLPEIETVQRLFESENPSEIIGLSTGFNDLDEQILGLQASDLIIVAGRPSMGKTTFAMNIAETIAVRAGKKAAVFSMEMSAEQLTRRFIGSAGKLDQLRLRTGKLNDHDWYGMSVAMGKLKNAQIFIDDSPALTTHEIRSRARRLKREHPDLAIIIIDYLQLARGASKRFENRTNEVSEISQSFKALAKELNVPVIAISQLNRSLENRPNKRPIMSDLRESGAIEQDADLILFIYRDEIYNPDTDQKGTAEIIIGKQRNGPIGTIRLAFLGEYSRFENLDKNWQPEPRLVSIGNEGNRNYRYKEPA